MIYVVGTALSNKIWMAPSTCVGEESVIEKFIPLLEREPTLI